MYAIVLQPNEIRNIGPDIGPAFKGLGPKTKESQIT